MSRASARPSRRQRGEIETLPSGSLRVRVYAGIDAISGKRHYLAETVPAGPKAAAEAEKVRRRLVNQVDEQRNPRTKATVNQLMDRYLELLDVEETTRERYEQVIRVHIRPLLGHLPVATGARRGEFCAMRWDRLDLDRAVLTIKTSIAQKGTHTWEKNTKTHQQRRIALDDDTVALLRTYRQQCEQDAAAVGTNIAPDGRIFSASIDHSTWLRPSSVSNRYARMCKRLGWDMNLHQLRHYSATELIAAGVDVRTVAGRLGHGGGGSTTLRAYTAWVAEADQRAMKASGVRMPAPPIGVEVGNGPLLASTPPADLDSPYQRIAADLRAAITCGALAPGDALPTIETLRERYKVSAGTANRAVAVLKSAGLVNASRGRRAVVSRSLAGPPA